MNYKDCETEGCKSRFKVMTKRQKKCTGCQNESRSNNSKSRSSMKKPIGPKAKRASEAYYQPRYNGMQGIDEEWFDGWEDE